MATDVARDSTTRAGFQIPEKIPAGNWLAHQLRLINMQSEGLLPESAGSKRSYKKYNTVTQLDFIPPDEEFQEEEQKLDSEPFQKKRETVADIMLAPHSKQLFLNWNVPNRYMPGKEDGTIEHFDPPLHLQSGEEGKLDTIQEDIKELSVPPSPVKSARSQKVPAPEMPARQMSLPELRLKSPDKGLIAKQYTKLAAGTTAPQAVPKLLSRSKTDIQPKVVSPIPKKCPGKDNVQDIRQELQQSLQPQVVDRAEHWMKLAPQADRKVIERVLRMAEKRQKQSMNLSRALQPNAKEAVEKWLSGANEDERQVALRFFNSVAGEKLMGMSMAEQKKRLQQVISTLEKVEKIQSERGKGAGPYADTSKLRVRRSLGEPRGPCNHLRLLSPGTRRDRWMHTTWHHLPEYKTDNIVENKSSHYTQPQAMIPRHFVIHPDWG